MRSIKTSSRKRQHLALLPNNSLSSKTNNLNFFLKFLNTKPRKILLAPPLLNWQANSRAFSNHLANNSKSSHQSYLRKNSKLRWSKSILRRSLSNKRLMMSKNIFNLSKMMKKFSKKLRMSKKPSLNSWSNKIKNFSRILRKSPKLR